MLLILILEVSINNIIGSSYHGTGSKPLPPHGWQRLMRFIVSQKPLNKPYLRKAANE